MKYFETIFTIQPCSQDARDILSAMSAEAGFETFEETETGLKGYVQQALFDRDALDAAIGCFPIEGTTITYTVNEAEEKDWNEQWEQEGFEPIVINGDTTAADNRPTVIIHDGRHLPEVESDATMIEIDAKMAFGTGTHETTRMICTALATIDLQGKRMLDCGCGTGILGICALKLGATFCTAYDIDEWSVDNTRHNAVINLVDSRLQVLHGDASILDTLTDRYDIVAANINRNILLQDMPRFVEKMHTGSLLLLSGFYQSDCPQLQEKAEACALVLQDVKTDGEWTMMVFSRK